MEDVVLGLDVGGTKLAAGIVDSAGTMLAWRAVPTQNRPDAGPEDVWSALTSVATEVLAAAGVTRQRLRGIGIGCGGPMRWPEGVVSPLNLSAWREFPLRDRLVDWLPDRPVRLHNDAVCFAIAEHWRGAARGADAVMGVVMSTGVGGGLILGGRVVDGLTGNAGHVGHVLVEPGGPRCECGARGCLEAVARGPALVQWALQYGWVPIDGVAAEAAPSAVQLAVAARAGDRVAIAAFARAGTALARALASATNLLDLDVVVVGGGLANAGDLLFEPLMSELGNFLTMEFAQRLKVRRAGLGAGAGTIGGAALIAAGEAYWSRS